MINLKLAKVIVGATWTLPIRFATYTAQLSATTAVYSGTDSQLLSLTAGVFVGWLIRVADNAINEFLVFERLARWLK